MESTPLGQFGLAPNAPVYFQSGNGTFKFGKHATLLEHGLPDCVVVSKPPEVRIVRGDGYIYDTCLCAGPAYEVVNSLRGVNNLLAASDKKNALIHQ